MKEHNGKSIDSGKLPPREAIRVQVGLVSILGPALFNALSKRGSKGEEVGEGILTMLASSADDEKVLKLVDTCLTVARIDGKKVSLDSLDVFGGDPMLVWVTTLHVLQENFGDFISGVRSRFGHLASKVAAPQSNPSN